MNLPVILVSNFSVPTNRITSWPKMYDYYMIHYGNLDWIVCPEEKAAPVREYSDKVIALKEKKGSIRFYRRYWFLIKKVLELVKKNEMSIIQIVDNHGILVELAWHLTKKKLRHKAKLLFFMRGFSHFFDNEKSAIFYSQLDEIIYLTEASYRFESSRLGVVSCEVSILNNGINSDLFFAVDAETKQSLRREMAVEEDSIVFLWLSQDRPKKGLDIILRAWPQVVSLFPQAQLWIVGAFRRESHKNVTFFGKIPNHLTTKYYQVCDFFLFSSLCHEGFGQVMIEGLKCGAWVLASDLPTIRSVLQNGKLGYLVDFPHRVQSWSQAMIDNLELYLREKKNPYNCHITRELYDLDQWCNNFEAITVKWQKRLSAKSY